MSCCCGRQGFGARLLEQLPSHRTRSATLQLKMGKRLPKHVELFLEINKLLLLHPVGFLCYFSYFQFKSNNKLLHAASVLRKLREGYKNKSAAQHGAENDNKTKLQVGDSKCIIQIVTLKTNCIKPKTICRNCNCFIKEHRKFNFSRLIHPFPIIHRMDFNNHCRTNFLSMVLIRHVTLTAHKTFQNNYEQRLQFVTNKEGGVVQSNNTTSNKDVTFNYETTCFGQKRPSSGFTPIKRIRMWGVGVEISTYHPLFTVQTMDM